MSESRKGIFPPRRVLRIAIGGALVVLVAAIVVFVATRTPAPKKAPPIQARLELAAGEVLVDAGSGEERAVSGTALIADAKLRTDKGARALVRLPDGSSIFMRGDSAAELGVDAIALGKGEYWLDAPPTDRRAMVHRAGDVAVSAADTGLSFRRDGDSVVVYVARGMATLTAKGGRVEVKAGEQASVQGGEAPRVAPLAFWDDWTGGMADAQKGRGLVGAGNGTIYGVDEGSLAGSAARRLEISRQAVNAVVREGLSETEVDQTFFNPGERPVEGWYWFTVPERATVTWFAVETNGVLVPGEFIEKREAAAQYGAAKASGHSPAILEWIDTSTYRARIFPVPAGGTRRVVVRYLELRPIVENKLEYLYPMGSGEPVRIGEFSLSVKLPDAGTRMKIATLADARIEENGKVVTMRRSGYTPRAPFQLEAKLPEGRPPFTLARFSAGGDSADYVLARYTPDHDWSKVKQQRADVVVVVDTSAAGDEAMRQLKTATAEAILRALSDDDRFALVSLDVRPTVLHPQQGLAPASEQEIAKALESLADHSAGGATDLASMFDVTLGRVHGADQPAVVYVGDGIATSGEMTGEQLVERLRRALTSSRARLFTVGVGLDADHSLLGELARAGGGATFRVDEADQTTARALELASAVKVPTITDLEIDLGAGLDEPFITASGKLSRGAEVAILARTHHDIPSTVKVKGRLAGDDFEKEYDVKRDTSIVASFVPKLWAAEYVRRLLGASQGPDAERGRIVALGVEYGLLTPFTSVLALESESAYSRMGIQRRHSPLRGEKLSSLDPASESRVAATLAAAAWPTASMALGCGKFDRSAPSQREEPPMAASPVATSASEGVSAGSRAKAEEGTLDDGQEPNKPAEDPSSDDLRQNAKEAELDKGAGLAASPAPEPAPLSGLDAVRRGGGALPPPPALPKVPAAARSPAKQMGRDEASEHGLIGLMAGEKKKAKPVTARPAQPIQPLSWGQGALATCSDTSSRPLAQRVLIWKKRLKTAKGASELVQRYQTALRACELDDWQAERTFLDFLQKRIDDEAGIELVLRSFSARPDVQKFLAKLILRRAVDMRVVNAVERVLFGNAVDWNQIDLELQAIEDVEKRISKLREQIARAPDDPNGGIRLVKLLVAANHKDEALALGRRLRDQGFLTPHIARQLGDVLARARLDAEAVRTYSEIVEFDPESIASRRLLGDIYLGHGWYEPAYRQYITITEAAPADALGWLRLASAAAGTGRIDEALRLERKVSSAQGNPGPTDPRRWARLLSAARLARLIDKPPNLPGQPKIQPASVKRELKELQLFSGPSALVIVTWEELDANLVLVTREAGTEVALGEATDAAAAGLSSVLLPSADAARVEFATRLRSAPRDRAVRMTRHDITWDGKDFRVVLAQRELAPQSTALSL